jgi:hypothetical protein
VFSRASNQDDTSRAKAGAIWVQERTIQAREQLTPLARTALDNANRGVYQARVWAAPRVELAGVAVQERIAPAVSSAMVDAARRMQPIEPRQPRRRWPAILAGIVTVSAGCAAAILLRGQRAAKFDVDPAAAPPPPPVPPASGTTGSNEMTEGTQVDANGQVRTP